ncbi:hypothetical protein BLOT_009243, partial [Blomia tropicalis]
MSIQDDCQLVTLISQKWGKAGKPYEPYLFKQGSEHETAKLSSTQPITRQDPIVVSGATVPPYLMKIEDKYYKDELAQNFPEGMNGTIERNFAAALDFVI